MPGERELVLRSTTPARKDRAAVRSEAKSSARRLDSPWLTAVDRSTPKTTLHPYNARFTLAQKLFHPSVEIVSVLGAEERCNPRVHAVPAGSRTAFRIEGSCASRPVRAPR